MFKGDSRDFGESFGEWGGGEWEGKEKILRRESKELDSKMSQGPELQEPRADASLGFSAEARHYLGLHSQAPASSRQWV